MFRFKKIASLFGSALMLSSMVAFSAAAANYPAPFVQGGSPDVALVYGSQAPGSVDLAAAVNIMDSLNSYVVGGTNTGVPSSVSGEAVALFSSGKNKIYLNNTLNSHLTTLTKTDLPTALADYTFDGDQSAKMTSTVKLGGTQYFMYSKAPSSDDDPVFNLDLGTNYARAVYNLTVDFDKSINFTHADSEGEEITLFGQRYTVGSATDSTYLVLFKSSESVFLNSDTSPEEQVTIEGKGTYTVSLVAASDTSATIRLTDSSGNSDQKEITEATSKKILGIEVGVTSADENNFRLTAEVTLGAEKLKMSSGNEIRVGSDETTVDGTRVTFSNAALASGTTQIVVEVAASDSDMDALLAGGTFVDPVFGNVKLSMAGVANDDNRETISIQNSGNDKMTLSMTDYRGNEKNLNWVYNATTITHLDAPSVAVPLLADANGDPIYVREMAAVNKSQYTLIGNENEARLIEVNAISNSSGDYSGDAVSFKDVYSGETYDVTITSEGSGTVSIGGNSYSVTYFASPSTLDSSARYVRINDPDSTSTNVNVFQTIQTESGAKIGLYQPTKLSMTNWDGLAGANNLTGIKVPDGDGYSTITVSVANATGSNFTFPGGSQTFVHSLTAGSVTGSIGRLVYNISASGTANVYNLHLQTVAGANIAQPALVVFEEQDDNDNYEAMIVTLEGVGTDSDGLGVAANGVSRTSWSTGGFGYPQSTSYTTHEADTDISSAVTLWGSLITLDSSESDQRTATISYPDDQVHAELYFGAADSTVTGGSSGSGSGTTVGVPIMDTEVSSVASKNLVVVGGSCVNSFAATLLGSTTPLCGADFTARTNVASGQFLIETFSRSGGKVATLVAGYNAGDTTNAATYLRTQSVDTMAGKKYVGTSATSAQLVTS